MVVVGARPGTATGTNADALRAGAQAQHDPSMSTATPSPSRESLTAPRCPRQRNASGADTMRKNERAQWDHERPDRNTHLRIDGERNSDRTHATATSGKVQAWCDPNDGACAAGSFTDPSHVDRNSSANAARFSGDDRSQASFALSPPLIDPCARSRVTEPMNLACEVANVLKASCENRASAPSTAERPSVPSALVTSGGPPVQHVAAHVRRAFVHDGRTDSTASPM